MVPRKVCISDFKENKARRSHRRSKRPIKESFLDLNRTSTQFWNKNPINNNRLENGRATTLSPSPVSFKCKKKFNKIRLRMHEAKEQEACHFGTRNPVSPRIHNLNLAAFEHKKKSGNFKLTRKMRQTPFSALKTRIKSLSPNLRKAVHLALSHSTETKRKAKKCIKKKKIVAYNNWASDKLIPLEHNMSNVLGYMRSKFESFHSKITSLKSSPGLCQSSYMLNQKLEELRSSKEKSSDELQISREMNINF
ncbi:unnamed protein product [Moneuplotes crassus]|uniref:Uncharacterized protein n=1 Tax=Euplotes crassus TaxID=5936 RepID=A0AAD1X4Y3_EUPCR|nr:unnamed protein product [Moneuplotes crassus]